MTLRQLVRARFAARTVFVVGVVLVNAPLTDMRESYCLTASWTGVILIPVAVCVLFLLRRIGKQQFPRKYS